MQLAPLTVEEENIDGWCVRLEDLGNVIVLKYATDKDGHELCRSGRLNSPGARPEGVGTSRKGNDNVGLVVVRDVTKGYWWFAGEPRPKVVETAQWVLIEYDDLGISHVRSLEAWLASPGIGGDSQDIHGQR